MSKVQPIPAGCHTLAPHLVVRGAANAIEFYKKAFGAEELRRMPAPQGGLLMHAELKIGDSRIMLCDEFPMPGTWRSPQSLGGTTVTVHLFTADADATFERAVKAGATVKMPLTDMFWGDRYGRLADPFGHEWSIATHIKDLSADEVAAAAAAAFNK